MRTALLGVILLVLGAVAIATGILPVPDALDVANRVWPILLFVVAITVVTELAAEAGLFTVVAERLAKWGLDRAWLLWLLVVVLATACTVFLSLDTTAVLLTPVVVLLARHVGLPPLPFAMTTIWLANTASLLLPVSNLTNLLAEHELATGPFAGPIGFAALMAVPALVCIVVPSVVLFVVYRRALLARYEPKAGTSPEDRVLLGVSAVVVILLVPALVSGIAVWIPAAGGAIVLAAFFAARRTTVLKFSILPWQIVVFASGLFLVVQAAGGLGLTTVLSSLVGTGDSGLDLLRLSGVAVGGANVVNNLPAYLALEPVAGSPLRLAALLIGVNAGPLITPWASLATLLWHERLRALDVHIQWKHYIGLGCIVVPITVVPAVLLLLAVH
ncbi:arsenic transporter [Frondihabitans sp. PAMC 28766]|uniref:SLC13 family permease n=1 Tax=Frondihabitans sp. PAMC 28766 TaxID=1795630 RepID=UPI00078CB3AF|nr:SLC13 family permease [Frondihabitans sp. PAMC 28766]AMM22434.1 arsenic transporter [Frondihabitans sp. PAMC 28766]